MAVSTAVKANVFEKLNNLCSEIEASIKGFHGTGTKENLALELDNMKEKAYLERTPEAQHATLLFRKYSNMVKEQQREDAGHSIGSDGFWDPDLTKKNPFKNYGKYVEGTADTLQGEAAIATNTFVVKCGVCLFSFLAFVVLCSNADIQQAELTPAFMTTSSCYLWSYGHGASGAFSMVSYQLVIALVFFIWLHSSCWCIYYVLPVKEDTGHKYIPGCGDLLERCMHCMDLQENHRTNVRSKNEQASTFCFRKAKLVDFVVDLFFVCLSCLLLIIASIDIERGAEFLFNEPSGSTYSAWYTIGTFHLTFMHQSCIDKPDPSDTVRAGLAMSYLSLFFLVLSTMISYDSYRKHLNRQASGDQDRDGVLPEHFDGASRGDRDMGRGKGTSDMMTGLVAHTDAHDDDDVVNVNL